MHPRTAVACQQQLAHTPSVFGSSFLEFCTFNLWLIQRAVCAELEYTLRYASESTCICQARRGLVIAPETESSSKPPQRASVCLANVLWLVQLRAARWTKRSRLTRSNATHCKARLHHPNMGGAGVNARDVNHTDPNVLLRTCAALEKKW